MIKRAEKKRFIDIVSTERLLLIINENRDSKASQNSTLHKIVEQFISGLLSQKESDIYLNFADIKTLIGYDGVVLINSAQAVGENSIIEALKLALKEPFPANLSPQNAKGVLIHFSLNPNYPVAKVSEAIDFVEKQTNEDILLRFGTTADESIDIDDVRVIIALTHF